MTVSPVVVSDTRKSKLIDGYVSIGQRFAFVDVESLESEIVQALSIGLEPGETKAVLPVVNGEPLLIGGLRISLPELPGLKLDSISCDRMIYRQGKDTVHVLVINNQLASAECEVVLYESSRSFATRSVQLNRFGAGEAIFQNLPAGNFQVSLSGEEQTCSFTVAEYKLAAMDADLKAFQFHEGDSNQTTDTIEIEISLTTFGHAVTGRVSLDLINDGEQAVSRKVESCAGLVKASFPVVGDGPFSVNIQSVEDPSRTATVILKGATTDERTATEFSNIGPRVRASLLARPDSTNIRGLHLFEDGVETSPVHVRQRTDQVELDFAAKVDCCCVQVVQLAELASKHKTTIHNFAEVVSGDSKRVAIKGSLNLIGIAGFVDGKPWERWCAVVAESKLQPTIEIPQTSVPGESCEITLQSEQAEMAYVVVKDARMPAGDSPSNQLAGKIKSAVERQDLRVRQPTLARYLHSAESSLYREGIISSDQLLEAISMSEQSPYDIGETLVDLGFATELEVGRAIAAAAGIPFIDLEAIDIPETMIELLPEAVARENDVMPIREQSHSLVVAVPDPRDLDTFEKLRFILNRNIRFEVATRSSIRLSIDRHYGQIEGETADSLLMEFTDTAINFTESIYDASPIDLSTPRRINLSSIASLEDSSEHHSTQETTARPTRQQSRTRPAMDCEIGDVLFAGMVPVVEGRAIVTVQLNDWECDYVVDAFVFSSNDNGFDWSHTSTRFRGQKDLFVEFDMPHSIHERDGALGRIYFKTPSGKARVQLTTPTKTIEFEYPVKGSDQQKLGRHEFLATLGDYAVTVEDLETREIAERLHSLTSPGEIERLVQPTRVLKPGEVVSLIEDSDIKSIQLFQNIDLPLLGMMKATCDYQHLCCEQTAAKVRAAIGIYILSSQNSTEAHAAVDAIIAGVDRMDSMFLPRGGGFKSYPESSGRNKYWGELAAQHLLALQLIEELDGVNSNFRDAVDRGLKMARLTTRVSGKLSFQSSTNPTLAEAYSVIRFSSDTQSTASASEWVRQKASDIRNNIERHDSQTVTGRANNAYLSACLIRISGDESDNTDLMQRHRDQGIELASSVLQAINETGRLYSTLDSAAAIAMMSEIRSAQIFVGMKQAKINGELMDSAAIAQFDGEIQLVEAVEGSLFVQLTRHERCSWNEFNNSVPVQVSLRSTRGVKNKHQVLDRLNLTVKLTDGYQFGDFLIVSLPDSLTWVHGGAQVKQFSVDFAEQNTIELQLVATSETFDIDGSRGPHHFAICVRNMYDEQRVGMPGLLQVEVTGN